MKMMKMIKMKMMKVTGNMKIKVKMSMMMMKKVSHDDGLICDESHPVMNFVKR